MTLAAKQLVLTKLKTVDWKTDFLKREIQNIINLIEMGTGSNGRNFSTKMRQMDSYRRENFLHTHPEIAEAMGYGKT
jgi:hypothetical protein